MGTTTLTHCEPQSIGEFKPGTLEVTLAYASATPNWRNGEVDVLDGPDPASAKKYATFTEEELARRHPQTKSTIGTTKDIEDWPGGKVYLHLRTEKQTGTRPITHKVDRHPPAKKERREPTKR